MRYVPVTLIFVALSGGCAMRGQGKNTAYVIDGAVAVGGVVLIASAQRDSCTMNDPDVLGDHATCEFGELMTDAYSLGLGAALLVGAAVGALVNAAINTEEPSAEALAPAPRLITVPDTCGVRIAAWRDARDPVSKTLLYRDMPATCRAQIAGTPPPAGSPAAVFHAAPPTPAELADAARDRELARRCAPELSAWRRARSGSWQKLRLHDQMSTECRRLASAPGPATR
jgi:hypothetical protein